MNGGNDSSVFNVENMKTPLCRFKSDPVISAIPFRLRSVLERDKEFWEKTPWPGALAERRPGSPGLLGQLAADCPPSSAGTDVPS